MTNGALLELLRTASPYRKVRTVEATRTAVAVEWRTERGDPMLARAGDWILNDGTSRWSVDADVFAATYAPVVGEPGRFRKEAPIMAVQLAESAQVHTKEGVATAAPGDWIAMNPAGDVWPIPNDAFIRTYQPAERSDAESAASS